MKSCALSDLAQDYTIILPLDYTYEKGKEKETINDALIAKEVVEKL